MGFVREKDVQRTIAGTRAAMTREARLIHEFPELNDEKSEFYQATTRHFKEICADDPTAVNNPNTLKLAAKLAKAELGDAVSAEESRAARVSRQSGGRSARPAGGGGRGGNQELSPAQSRIIENLRAVGADISEEGYRKRATSGVRMAGVRRRG
jgi:hypothetical protein